MFVESVITCLFGFNIRNLFGPLGALPCIPFLPCDKNRNCPAPLPLLWHKENRYVVYFKTFRGGGTHLLRPCLRRCCPAAIKQEDNKKLASPAWLPTSDLGPPWSNLSADCFLLLAVICAAAGVFYRWASRPWCALLFWRQAPSCLCVYTAC